MGLAYSVGGGWGATYDHPGLFQISGSTKSQSTVDTIQAALAEVNKIRTAEVTDQELDTAKQSVLNSFVFQFRQPEQDAEPRGHIRILTGYPKDFIFQYQKGVQAVTKADVLRVAKEYLKPEAISIVAVGKPSDFGKPLTTLGEVKQIDLSIPEPSKVPLPRRPTVRACRAGRSTACKRLSRLSAGRISSPPSKDYTQNGRCHFHQSAREMKASQTNQWIAVRNVSPVAGIRRSEKSIAFYDGKSNWLATPQGHDGNASARAAPNAR